MDGAKGKNSKLRRGWLVAVMVAVLALLYYLPGIFFYVHVPLPDWAHDECLRDLFQSLLFIPVLYAAVAFGLVGMTVAVVSSILIFIPHALFFSPYSFSLPRLFLFAIGLWAFGYFLDLKVKGLSGKRDLEAREMLEDVIEIIPEGFLCFSDDRRLVKENRAFREIIETYAPKYKGDLLEKVLREIRDRIKIGEGKGEIRFDVEGGELIMAFRQGKKLSAPGEGYVFVSLKDISKQRKAEELLVKSEEEYRSLVESTDDSIYLVDRGCRYTFVNEKHLSRLHVEREDVIGTSYGDFHTEEETKEFARLVGHVFRTGRSLQHEHRSDRDNRYFLRTLSPIKDTKGEVIAVTVISKEITDRKVAEEKMRYVAFHDALTGVYNRAYFEEEMTRIDSERHYPVAIVVLDINGLKLVNDAMGHKMGDELIKNAAQTIQSACRKGDVVARIGGDEFAVILPKCDEEAVRDFCERFHKACQKKCKSFAAHLNLSVSMGYAVQTGRYKSMEEVYRKADENMYREKIADARSREMQQVAAYKAITEEKDPHTIRPGESPQDLAEVVGKTLGLLEFELDRLKLLALLHDIGKIAVMDKILLKPGKLTEEEWEIMKQHVEEGYRMAIGIPPIAPIATEILHHHERWDGKGYPAHLKDGEIPLLARIVAIIDAYDAMVNERPYRRALPKKEAIRKIKEGAGTKFDPNLVEIFLSVMGVENLN